MDIPSGAGGSSARAGARVEAGRPREDDSSAPVQQRQPAIEEAGRAAVPRAVGGPPPAGQSRLPRRPVAQGGMIGAAVSRPAPTARWPLMGPSPSPPTSPSPTQPTPELERRGVPVGRAQMHRALSQPARAPQLLEDPRGLSAPRGQGESAVDTSSAPVAPSSALASIPTSGFEGSDASEIRRSATEGQGPARRCWMT